MSVPPDPPEECAELAIELGLDADADDAELDEATARVRNELLQLDVDSVERPVAGEVPTGVRAVDVLTLGALVVKLGRNAGALAAVVRALQAWLARDAKRSVKIELDGDTLEVTGVSSEEQKRLIDAWIARHASPTG